MTTFHVPALPADDGTPHLGMAGQARGGRTFVLGQRCIFLDGKPVLPVSGEFHFSRYPNEFWERELLKMKACGITMIATYVFWIHHEEIEGVFDWNGDRDLRAFIQLCARHGFLVFLRMGPFCHGECRNGGIPDWAWGTRIERTADPAFLDRVKILYREIAGQVNGLLFKDGGPVVMVQLENEMTNGERGIPYMQALKRIAMDAGIDVPAWTATGWGDASIPPGELVPTFGGYPEAPWAISMEPFGTDHSKNFFFTAERDDGFIGTDQPAGAGGREKYRHPYLTSEIGPGIQVTYHRRPVIQARDVLAIAIVKLGSGVNMLGYYVFHGGTHPVGKLATMQETLGRPSMLEYPVFSYDFQAPLGEFGQVRPSYHRYRLLHLLVGCLGDRLAPMIPVMPDGAPTRLDDVDILRAAIRTDGTAGFVFYNNHDRNNGKMHDLDDVTFTIALPSETVSFPDIPLRIKRGTQGIIPFNLNVHGVVIHHATAQPVTVLPGDSGATLVLVELDGIPPVLAFTGASIEMLRVPAGRKGTIQRGNGVVSLSGMEPGRGVQASATACSGARVDIVVLAMEDALRFWTGDAWGRTRAVISTGNVYFDAGDLVIHGDASKATALSIFPGGDLVLSCNGQALVPAVDGMFYSYTLPRGAEGGPGQLVPVVDPGNESTWLIDVPNHLLDGCSECFLHIDYVGNHATLHVAGTPVADDFYTGEPWVVGIKRWSPRILGTTVRLVITPLEGDDDVYLERWPVPQERGAQVAKLERISVVHERELRVTGTAGATGEKAF